MSKQQKKKLSSAKTVADRSPVKGKTSKTNSDLFQLYAGLAAIVLLALIAFFPAVKNGFSNFDDPALISNNPLIKEISGINIKRIFSEIYFANYQPLHLFSYMIEYHFFGLKASGYHWVSIVMHLINILLVARIVFLISKNNYITFFTTLFFAITPMRVESVVWAAERKDMLYSLFFFAAMISYLLYVQKDFKRKYILFAFLFFTLSVFSKTMAVSIVPVMFLIDFFYGRKFNVKNILEKIPFIGLAVVMGLISVHAASSGGSMDADVRFSFIDRLFFACQNLLMYASKLVFPYGLSGYYQYPVPVDDHIPYSYFISGAAIVLAATVIFLSLKKTKLIFFSAGYFFSTVALVLMILPVGPTIFSERYSYVPSVMLYFILLHYLFQWIVKQHSKSLQTAFSVGLIAYSLFLVSIVHDRIKVWKDPISFWTDVISTNPKVPIAFNNRGNEYKTKGEYKNAVDDFTKAIQLNSNFPDAVGSLGEAYRAMGSYDSALVYAARAIKMKPDWADAYITRGIVRAMKNNLDSSLMDFNRAIQLNPDKFEAYCNRGNINCIFGKFDEGLKDYDTATKINPDLADPYINRGRLLFDRKKIDEAMENFNMYLQKEGKNPLVYLMIAQCYAAKSDFASAIRFAEQAKAGGLPGVDGYMADWKK